MKFSDFIPSRKAISTCLALSTSWILFSFYNYPKTLSQGNWISAVLGASGVFAASTYTAIKSLAKSIDLMNDFYEDHIDADYVPAPEPKKRSPQTHHKLSKYDKCLKDEIADLQCDQAQTTFTSFTAPGLFGSATSFLPSAITQRLPSWAKDRIQEREVEYTVPAHKAPQQAYTAGGYDLRYAPRNNRLA